MKFEVRPRPRQLVACFIRRGQVPFGSRASDGRFMRDDAVRVTLVQVDDARFDLPEGHSFSYQDPYVPDAVFDVTREGLRGAGTDLTSVPSLLWWYVGSYGRHTRAALVHDVLVRSPSYRDKHRRRADQIFLRALAESDVPVVRRWLMWTAVSLETSFLRRVPLLPKSLKRVAGGFFLAVHFALVVAAIVNWAWTDWWLKDHVWWQAGLALAALVSWVVVWGRRALWVPAGMVLIGPPYAVVWWFKRTSGVLEWPASVIRALGVAAWKAWERASRKRPEGKRESSDESHAASDARKEESGGKGERARSMPIWDRPRGELDATRVEPTFQRRSGRSGLLGG